VNRLLITHEWQLVDAGFTVTGRSVP
jgi:hypothetical protein